MKAEKSFTLIPLVELSSSIDELYKKYPKNYVWICSEPAGAASPSVTALRAFQNIGFDVYETL